MRQAIRPLSRSLTTTLVSNSRRHCFRFKLRGIQRTLQGRKKKTDQPVCPLLSPIKVLGAREARHVTRSHYNHSSPPDHCVKKDSSIGLHDVGQTTCAHMTLLLLYTNVKGDILHSFSFSLSSSTYVSTTTVANQFGIKNIKIMVWHSGKYQSWV